MTKQTDSRNWQIYCTVCAHCTPVPTTAPIGLYYCSNHDAKHCGHALVAEHKVCKHVVGDGEPPVPPPPPAPPSMELKRGLT